MSELVDWELVLTADNVQASLAGLPKEIRLEIVPDLSNDLQTLLLDALSLLQELGSADERSDRSFIDLPSISPHPQNQKFRDWVALIELLRESWEAIRKMDPARATRIAEDWFDLPFPAFKRLALFAASKDDCVAPKRWVQWLTSEEGWWLWSTETHREALRLLVTQAKALPPNPKARLVPVRKVGISGIGAGGKRPRSISQEAVRRTKNSSQPLRASTDRSLPRARGSVAAAGPPVASRRARSGAGCCNRSGAMADSGVRPAWDAGEPGASGCGRIPPIGHRP